MLPVYDIIVPALLSGGVWNLPKTCNFTLGVPIGPMLAKPTKGVGEILNKFQDTVFTCEYKYDGERAQVIYPMNAIPGAELFKFAVKALAYHQSITAGTLYGGWYIRDI